MKTTVGRPVEFLPSPNGGKDEVLKIRRESSKALAEAALKITRLEELAFKDTVTGLPNRAVLDDQLPNMINISRSENSPLALAILDVNGLKRTNEAHGLQLGDELLKTVIQAFDGLLRENDVVGRMGGDEFYALLPGYEPLPGRTLEELNKTRKDRLKLGFSKGVKKAGIPDGLYVGLAVGIVVLAPDDTPESFIHRGDLDMKADKATDRKLLEEAGIVFQDSRMFSEEPGLITPIDLL